MNGVKQIFAASITVTLLFFSTAAFAQMQQLRNTTPLQRAKLETFFMKKRLSLTPRQTSQVMRINLKYAKRMDPILKGTYGKPGALREAASLRQAKDRELTRVLSPGQYQGYLASKEQVRQKMVEKMMHKRAHSG